MATYTWTVPTEQQINGQTYIKETDNKIQATMDDLVDFVNGEGDHAGQGLTYDLIDKATAQTIAGVKTFNSAIQADGGINGNISGVLTGSVSGNSSTATKLATARNITISGSVTGSASFDGASNVNIVTSSDMVTKDGTQTITGAKTFSSAINANGGVTGNVTGSLVGNASSATKLATTRTISLSGDITGSASFDGSANATIITAVKDDSHNHMIANIDGLQTALNAKQSAGTYNTVIGTDTDIDTSGSTIIDNIYVTDGVITSMGTRTLSLNDLTGSRSLASNGSMQVNGLIIQWGYTPVTSNTTRITYSTFPNACVNLQLTTRYDGDIGGVGIEPAISSALGKSYTDCSTNSTYTGLYWYAIGY